MARPRSSAAKMTSGHGRCRRVGWRRWPGFGGGDEAVGEGEEGVRGDDAVLKASLASEAFQMAMREESMREHLPGADARVRSCAA